MTLRLCNERKKVSTFLIYNGFEYLPTLVVPYLDYLNAVVICDDAGQGFQKQIKPQTIKISE